MEEREEEVLSIMGAREAGFWGVTKFAASTSDPTTGPKTTLLKFCDERTESRKGLGLGTRMIAVITEVARLAQ